MPILSGGPLYRDKTKAIEDYPATLGQTAGAAFDRAVDTGVVDFFARGQEHFIGTALIAKDPERFAVRGSDAKAEAAKRNVTLDLADDATISRPELDTMLRLKERERKQLQTLNRRPQTWGGFAAEIGGGLVGSLTDPFQVAASFIPVVGQARYAKWIAAARGPLGRAGVRAGVGAAEGFVGSAIIEPFVYIRAQSLGLEYDATDSFMNFVFGTVLGGGLHVVGGAALDAISPARRAAVDAPEVKARAALAEAVTALDEGRALDVDPVFRDTAFIARELSRAPDIAEPDIARAQADIEAVAAGKTERAPDLIETIKSLGGIKIVDSEGRVTSEGGDVRDVFSRRYPPGLVNNKSGVPLDYVREALQEQGWLPKAGDGTNETTTADVLDLLSQWQSGKKPLPIGEVRGEDLTPVAAEIKAAGITKRDSPDVASFKLAKYRAEQARLSAPELVREPSIEPDTYDPVTGYEPPEMERVRMEADEALARPDDIDGEIEALNEMLAMAERRDPLTEYDRAAMDLADAFETRSRVSADSYRAAAACLSGIA